MRVLLPDAIVAIAMHALLIAAGSPSAVADDHLPSPDRQGVLQYDAPADRPLTTTAGVDAAPLDFRAFIQPFIYSPREVENWVAGRDTKYIGERYDPDVGWVHHEGSFQHGVDNAFVFYDYEQTGERRLVNYRDRPCRISSYGDSFTHCDQVSDGETWQEYLAAHLGEPVRNFGTSGHSVYQAYLRMRREESRRPARYIIFNIYSDDHFRSLYGWANLANVGVRRPTMPYIRQINPATGEFQESPNPCPTAESLKNCCDAEWVHDRFKEDFFARILLARANLRIGTPEASYADIQALARDQRLEMRVSNPAELEEAVELIMNRAALYASMRIVDRVEAFARAHDQKVLYVLSHVQVHVERMLREGNRFDQSFVDYLKEKNLPHVDLMDAHLADYAQFKGSVEDYLARYYIGHYNPRGNQFTAFAIKDAVIRLMSPPPPAYPR